MIEVLSSFECVTNTFFIAVDLMDTYLSKVPEPLESKTIHLIGITSMVLASKIEEITPFKVSIAVDKMSHGKLTAREIVKCELDMISALDFKLMNNSSLFVFTEMVLIRLNFHMSPIWKDVIKIITYITKLVMHDYKVLMKYPIEYLGCACVYLGFKIVEQARPHFTVRVYVEDMKIAFGLKEIVFYQASEDLLELAKDFENVYQFAKNLIKYDSFSLDKTD